MKIVSVFFVSIFVFALNSFACQTGVQKDVHYLTQKLDCLYTGWCYQTEYVEDPQTHVYVPAQTFKFRTTCSGQQTINYEQDVCQTEDGSQHLESYETSETQCEK